MLGRPFLTTSKAIINVDNGELTMKINVEVEVFKSVDECPNMIDLYTYLAYVCRSTCSFFSHATNQLDQMC